MLDGVAHYDVLAVKTQAQQVLFWQPHAAADFEGSNTRGHGGENTFAR